MPESHVVVFDSNVLIPLILPASLSTRLFLRLDAAGWEVAASPQVLAEVAEKVELAERIDESQVFVSRYERGETRLDLVQLRTICHALKTTLGNFVRKYEEQLAIKK